MLLTWALQEMPVSGLSQIAERLADHRLDYLSYEGPVSENRGVVSRWDEGTYSVEKRVGDLLVVQLSGQKLTCRSRMDRLPGPEAMWRITFASPAATDQR